MKVTIEFFAIMYPYTNTENLYFERACKNFCNSSSEGPFKCFIWFRLLRVASKPFILDGFTSKSTTIYAFICIHLLVFGLNLRHLVDSVNFLIFLDPNLEWKLLLVFPIDCFASFVPNFAKVSFLFSKVLIHIPLYNSLQIELNEEVSFADVKNG